MRSVEQARPRRETRAFAFACALALAACDGGPEPVPDGATWPDGGPPPRADAGLRPSDPLRCAPGLALPIRVRDHANVARERAPVSGGIPLGRGELFEEDLDWLALRDASGDRVESLQRPVVLGRWNDESIKWLLLDFLTDLAPGDEARFTLCRAETLPARSAQGITVEEGDDVFVVDTGALRAVLPKDHFSLLRRVWVDLDEDGAYGDHELVVDGPTEMFVDLDDAPPGPPDSGVDEHPDERTFGMEGGNWLRASMASSATRHSASAGAYQATLFRRGATHTVFRLEGWHRDSSGGRDFGRYTLYLHFYAGQTHVQVSHTWTMTGDPSRNFVRRMGISVPLSTAFGQDLGFTAGGAFEAPGDPVRFESSEPPFVPITRGPSELHGGALTRGGSVRVVSIGGPRYYHDVPLERDTRVPYRVLVGGAETASGFGASGWLDIVGAQVGVAAGVRDFWREHPKELAFRDGHLTVYLWPDEGDRTLDLRRRYPEVRGLASSLGRAARREFDPAGSAVGMAKTTDVVLHFHAASDRDRTDALVLGASDPLRPFAAPEHNVATGVFGPIPARDDAAFPRTERFIELTLAWPLRSAAEFGWHGMLDYGDHLIEYESNNWELPISPNWGVYANWGYSGWMQEAYRIGPALMVEYLRTGRDEYWREADVWLRHHRDVDCVHWDTPDDGPRPGDNRGGDRLGGGHRHDQQHWGGYLAGYGVPTIATAHHYFLTGDGRDLDAMRHFAEWILEHARIESHGRYSVLYMAEALDDPELARRALAREVAPADSFGRLGFDSGMGLLLHDVQTEGAPEVRERLRAFAAHPGEEMAFLRGYLEAVEGRGEHVDAIARDVEALFPAATVRARYFGWAPRSPTSFRDAFSPDIMPEGPWEWPIRSIEHLIFDAGGRGLGNNPSRQVFVAQLPWLMQVYGADPE